MNVEQFYNEFKSALAYLDLKWSQMDKANIKVQDGCIVMEYGQRMVKLAVELIE